MQFWNLFITAFMPVLKVLLITGVGAFLALDRFNILRETARNNLNTLVYYVFTPALVCSILTRTITYRSLVTLGFMPLNILVTFIAGTALGWLFMKITKAPRDMQGIVLGCCAAGNLGNLPIIIVPAVCKESGSPFGDVDACYKKGMALGSLSMAIGNLYIWTIVYHMVRIYSCKSPNVLEVDDSTLNPVDAIETDPENHSKSSIGPQATAEDISESDHNLTQFDIEETLPDRREKVLKQAKILTIVAKLNLKILSSPATVGSIVGLIIGVVPPLQKMFVGDNSPLRVIEDSASMLGDACIPANTLLVGANLLKGGLKGSRIKLSLIVGIIVVRNIALPVLGVGVVKAAVHFGMIHRDPLYQFTLMLQYALPPATSISTITQLFGAGETECSIVMLATYACASVSLTLWSTFFIWLVV